MRFAFIYLNIYAMQFNHVMTNDEKNVIQMWANENYIHFQKNGPGRQFGKIHDYATICPCVWDIKARIIDLENLNGFEQEPVFQDYIGYIQDGGQIHRHKDPNSPDGRIHIRFNVIVQLPVEGGRPIYADKVIDVSEGEYIKCRSGMDFHYCEKVVGPKARIVLSYGFLVPVDRITANEVSL